MATGLYGYLNNPANGYSQAYTYDRAGRLTRVTDHTAPANGGSFDPTGPPGTTCQTRDYTFDANGNRTSLTRHGANPDGTCSTTGGSTRSWSYDAADRYAPGPGPGSGSGYVYDDLGRVTTLPADDTPAGGTAGEVAIGYYDTDAVRSITQDGLTSTYTLDATGRRTVETTGPTSGPATTVTSHYADGSDNPAWTTKESGATTTTSRYLASLGGDLTATLTSAGTSDTANADLTLALANPHGDVVTTVPIPDTGPALSIDAWHTYDEYGNTPTEAVGNTPLRDATGIGYGWVGQKQRATQSTGLILMGARLYPQDPINSYDLDGECGWCGNLLRKAGKTAWKYKYDIAFTAVAFTPGLGQAAMAARGVSIAAKLGRAGTAAKNASSAIQRGVGTKSTKVWVREGVVVARPAAR